MLQTLLIARYRLMPRLTVLRAQSGPGSVWKNGREASVHAQSILNILQEA